MLLNYFRLFKYDTSITDLSLDNQNPSTLLTPSLVVGNYLYIAQEFPFNNVFFHLDTANTELATVNVEYFDGNWKQAVDVLDGTSVAGIPFAQSGVLQWSPDQSNGWVRIGDTSTEKTAPHLNTLKLYDLYWIRLSVTADLLAGLKFKEISYCFTTSDQLNHIDIEVNGFLAAFGTGKTDWNKEIITASKLVVSDLKARQFIAHQGQILRFDDISHATTLKALDLIYMNLGPSYVERRKEIRELYANALNVKGWTIDEDLDGFVDHKEVASKVYRLVR